MTPTPLRIDYLSPLPPVRSGIADYSVDLLPELAAREDVEVRVLRLPEQPVAGELTARWRPAPAARCGEDGRLPLYQMGNNLHHRGVRELALERPGVLVLHDLVLHHLLCELTLADVPTADGYVDALERDHGWVGRAVGAPRCWGGDPRAGIFALPAHRTLLRRQRGVLVHNAWAASMVREDDPEIAVRRVPMGIPLPAAAGPPGGEEARAARRALGLPADRPLLGSFGFQTPIKRTGVVVRALGRAELADAHLLVVGEQAAAVDLEAEARRAGVAARVHVTGFVDRATFDHALVACDLALNLRYPTAGETSASLLRLLAAGRPVVVSDYAQFRELPETVALRISLGDGEEERLAARVAALLADRERLRDMGAAARRHVAGEHAPARAAAAVAAACAELAGLEPPGDRPAAPPPPTSIAWPRLEGALRLDGVEAPWPPGSRHRLTLRAENRGRATWLATRRGPGGVAFVLTVATASRSVETGRWLPLPLDVPPGGVASVEFDLRRPSEPATLTVEPLILENRAGDRTTRLPAPCWRGELA